MPGTLQVISYTLSHLISPLQEPYEMSTIFFSYFTDEQIEDQGG